MSVLNVYHFGTILSVLFKAAYIIIASTSDLVMGSPGLAFLFSQETIPLSLASSTARQIQLFIGLYDASVK